MINRWIIRCPECKVQCFYTDEYPAVGKVPVSSKWFSCVDGEHPVPFTVAKCHSCYAPLSFSYEYLEGVEHEPVSE